MPKFYPALPWCSTINLKPCSFALLLPHFFTSVAEQKRTITHLLILSITTWLLVINTAAPARAQEATFFENFDNAATGQLPPGWTWFQSGGIDTSRHWIVSAYGFFGPRVAWSNFGDAAEEGDIDEDWLITPQITPAPGDYLIFDGAQEFVWDDFGSRFHVLISTTTPDPAAFTDTLATYTETEFPGYLYSETIKLDLAAYANTPVYIAFVHENPSNNMDAAEDFYLDNVWIRPIQSAGFYSAEVYWKGHDPIPVGKSSTHIIIGAKVRVFGDSGSASITSFTFTTGGTTDPSQIIEATLYTTGQDAFISTNDDEGTIDATVFGTVTNPGDTFEIKGSQELPIGDNYFWLVYTLKPDLVLTYPYPQADATLEKVVNEGEHVATVNTKEGSYDIVPPHPLNDNHADAFELSATPARYGSYNNRATFEPAYEKLAYCAPEGVYDVFNTIWWHFKAPGDGWITADLSPTQFNTVLVLQDTTFNQLACNDNVDASANALQSKITDFPVTKDQEIYIRVSGAGSAPGDPNGAAGLVVLDFAFRAPVVSGVEDPDSAYTLSLAYPNPAVGQASFDLVLNKPGKVTLEVYDLLGQTVLTHHEGFVSAGSRHQTHLNVSTLPAGLYLVHVQSNGVDQLRKLTVVR